MASDAAGNLDRFTGLADTYDAHRPTPPAVLAEVLMQLAQTARPRLVVDLGCGTGLSTRIWAGRADEVIGIEPNGDMRRQAESHGALPGIGYRDGLSTQTGLADGCADIVTCCQSLHWMEPEPTFAEISRVLRAGGVFAACDADLPPAMNWEIEAAYAQFHARVEALEKQVGIGDQVQRWPKAGHLERMKASGRFRWTKEVLLHQVEVGNGARLVGLSASFGTVPALLKKGVTEEQMGLTQLRAAARRILGDKPQPWYFSFRVRIGVK
jgi:ubiquinone/menaquinone biosynthesis C-methylase UbiE